MAKSEFGKAVDEVSERGIDVFGIGFGFGFAFIVLQLLVFFFVGQSGSFGFILISATFIGGIFGFLFGIPKINTDDIAADLNNPTIKTSRIYLINSNLNQVSDWLTKIIIGATLVNIKELFKNLFDFSKTIEDQLKIEQIKQSVVMVMILGFVSFGFLAGYMMTRIIWSPVFARADAELDNLKKAVDELAKKNKELVEQLQKPLTK